MCVARRLLMLSVLSLTACALGAEESEASNADQSPVDGGTLVQEGSILPPVDGTADSLEPADADGASDVDAAPDADPSICLSSPDGTVCQTAQDACHDDGVCTNGVCEAPALKPDGETCGAGDDCHDAPTCESGQCVPHEKADGTVCADAPNDCHSAGTCSNGVCGASQARPDGYNWDTGDAWKRCCGGQPRRMDSDENCGVCGIQCNASNGESCVQNAANGQYYCTGCSASSACWSGCCSNSYGTPRRCAASDCVEGLCQGCPAGTCKQWPNASNSCSFD